MGGIVNLRRARKAAARTTRRKEADARAAAFGLSKAEKRRQEAEREKAERDLSGHMREPADD